MNMANRFRNPVLRGEYDKAISLFNTKSRVFFLPDGSRPLTPGNSFASFFWRGYDGTKVGAGFIDRASKNTLAYAYYRAGEDARKSQDRK